MHGSGSGDGIGQGVSAVVTGLHERISYEGLPGRGVEYIITSGGERMLGPCSVLLVFRNNPFTNIENQDIVSLGSHSLDLYQDIAKI